MADRKAERAEVAERIRSAFKRRADEALTAAMRAAGAPSVQKFAEELVRREIPVSQQDLSAWVGGRIPEWGRMDEMEQALGVSWEWLLTGREPKAAKRTDERRQPLTARTTGGRRAVQEPPRRQSKASGQ